MHHVISKKSKIESPNVQWKLGEEVITHDQQYTHLGLEWMESKPAPDLQAKIDSSRGMSYALLGVGLHGQNGLDPATSYQIIQVSSPPALFMV